MAIHYVVTVASKIVTTTQSKLEAFNDHPMAIIGTGTIGGGAGVWALISQATSILGLIAAFFGALTGAYGACLLYRKWRRGTLFPPE